MHRINYLDVQIMSKWSQAIPMEKMEIIGLSPLYYLSIHWLLYADINNEYVRRSNYV